MGIDIAYLLCLPIPDVTEASRKGRWYKVELIFIKGKLHTTEGSPLISATGVVEHSAVTLIGLDLVEWDQCAGHSELPSLTPEACGSGAVVSLESG